MARHDHSPVTAEQRQTFLDRVAAGASLVEAAGSQSLRCKLYRLKDADPGFAEEWRRAYQEGTDALVAEARRRAVDGVEDVKTVGTGDMQREVVFRHYSDTLLMFLIKQRDPTFRENHKVEVTGQDGAPVSVEVKHSVDDLAAVASILARAGALPS